MTDFVLQHVRSASTSMLLSLAVLAAMFIPLERAWTARPQRIWRRAWALDLLFFAGQFLLWNALVVGLFTWLVAHWRTAGARPVVATWPLWLQAILAFGSGELLTYWLHRAFHRVPFLWRIHAVHHSSEQVDWLAAYREHPLDGLLIQFSMNAPAVLLGVALPALAPVVLLRGVWAVVVHANVRLPLGPLRWLLGAPEWHRYHHAIPGADGTTYNFGNSAPWLDALFGTHREPPTADYEMGLSDTTSSSAAWRHYWQALFLRNR